MIGVFIFSPTVDVAERDIRLKESRSTIHVRPAAQQWDGGPPSTLIA
jgi:hypothetical protein